MRDEPPQSSPNRHSGFIVSSTSNGSAVVSPIVLRETGSVRLVFKPVLVQNPHNPEASVNGIFCYQRKRRADEWEDVEAIQLSTLRSGEGVRLDIKSAEILKLYRGLQVLYNTVEQDGISTGSHTYIRADRGTVLADVAEMLANGEAQEILHTFLSWARKSGTSLGDHLRSVDGQTLVNFDAAIGIARLQQFVIEARENLNNNSEPYWQALLHREPWVISQLYAAPMVIVKDQAYVGGKSIDNRGGSVVDYMYANVLTKNSLIVEIKKPTADLLTTHEYRNGIYGPSSELSGGTQQVLHARRTFQEEYLTLTKGDNADVSAFATRGLLIIGRLPRERAKISSFELYRDAQRDVEIVTFDELIAKAGILIEALAA